MAYCRVCKGEHRKHARRGVASGGSTSRSSRRTQARSNPPGYENFRPFTSEEWADYRREQSRSTRRTGGGRLRGSGGSFTVHHENGMERTFPADSAGMSAARKWQASLPPGETWWE